MKNLIFMIGILLAAGLLSACASSRELVIETRCDRNGTALYMSGPTDQMLECVRQQERSIETVTLNSFGGEVGASLDVAEIIADWNATIIVEAFCASSCANYILPVAKRVIVSEGANIILHGSVDDLAVSKASSQDKAAAEGAKALRDRQLRFAGRFDVNLGWLLWRSADESSASLGRFVSSDRVPVSMAPGTTGLLVTPGFVRSCLPNVAFEWDTSSSTATLPGREQRQALAEKNGFMSTTSMSCRAEQTSL